MSIDAFDFAKKNAKMILTGMDPGKVTRELIRATVEKCSDWAEQQPGDVLDPLQRTRMARELEAEINSWVDVPVTLDDGDEKAHSAWLEKRDRSPELWPLWSRYREHLLGKWPESSVDSVDLTSDEILRRLEDPSRDGPWDRRGLVVGNVQSGKTANYAALIDKAVDAGYKLIVVLAGMHNNLRSQTQVRLDEDFLGYSSGVEQGKKPIGVGLITSITPPPQTITNRENKGDFNTTVAKTFFIAPHNDPLLFVIKKNATVLKNLVKWVRGFCDATESESGRKYVLNVPILVIDDEADNASVNVNPVPLDENGHPDEDHDPTRINSLIRQLLHSFDKSAYVGYTATPFANIFIHEEAATKKEGDDFFPRSFIVSLPAPSSHVGPARVFGITADPDAGIDGLAPLPLVRGNDDADTWMPRGHKKHHVPRDSVEHALPASLEEAVCAFILSGAAKMARGLGREHHSMLVHVTRFLAVQGRVHDQVQTYFEWARKRIRYGEESESAILLPALRALWERDFVTSTDATIPLLTESDARVEPLSWEEVSPHLATFVEQVELRLVNGQATDALEYSDHEEDGLKVIAIGGDKLSRGLTLEGLTVSYFLRASRMYDTLMQMGRWFGYRPSYLDLCRLYIPSDIRTWFEHITEANEELRREFDLMAKVNASPLQYGLRIRSHPLLLVTSQVKMKAAVPLKLSYAGQVSQTVVFDGRSGPVAENLAAVGALLDQLGSKPSAPLRGKRSAGPEMRPRLWSGVPAEAVLSFLKQYKTHPEAWRSNAQLLRRYIEAQVSQGELVSWTVALISTSDGRPAAVGGHAVRLVTRETGGSEVGAPVAGLAIRALLSPKDESLDLSPDEWKAALAATNSERIKEGKTPAKRPDPEKTRSARPKERGLLMLYPLDPKQIGASGHPEDPELPVIGIALSFPQSPTAKAIDYSVNHVYYNDRYGSDD